MADFDEIAAAVIGGHLVQTGVSLFWLNECVFLAGNARVFRVSISRGVASVAKWPGDSDILVVDLADPSLFEALDGVFLG